MKGCVQWNTTGTSPFILKEKSWWSYFRDLCNRSPCWWSYAAYAWYLVLGPTTELAKSPSSPLISEEAYQPLIYQRLNKASISFGAKRETVSLYSVQVQKVGCCVLFLTNKELWTVDPKLETMISSQSDCASYVSFLCEKLQNPFWISAEKIALYKYQLTFIWGAWPSLLNMWTLEAS